VLINNNVLNEHATIATSPLRQAIMCNTRMKRVSDGPRRSSVPRFYVGERDGTKAQANSFFIRTSGVRALNV